MCCKVLSLLSGKRNRVKNTSVYKCFVMMRLKKVCLCRSSVMRLCTNAIIAFLVFGMGGSISAQTAHKSLRYGDNSYKTGDYSDAEINYRRALEKENAAQSKYNLGNAIYKQGRYEEAIPQFEAAASSSLDPNMRANAFHNLGNAYFEKEEFDKSVEAYKNSLRIAPDDMDTKKNLSRAMRRVQQQQKQEQQQQQDQQDENKEKNEEDQEQQEQQQDDQQSDQQDENEQQQQDQEGEEQKEEKEKESEPQERDMNKEEAKKLLQVMDEEERKVQEKMRKMKGKKTTTGKDW